MLIKLVKRHLWLVKVVFADDGLAQLEKLQASVLEELVLFLFSLYLLSSGLDLFSHCLVCLLEVIQSFLKQCYIVLRFGQFFLELLLAIT